MSPAIHGILHTGSGGIIVQAECHLSNGLPSMVVVGLGTKAVDEARERVRSAFASSRLGMPRKRITINLAPADIPKDTTSLDICIAIAILSADNKLPGVDLSSHAFIGELGLDGAIRPVRGVIGKIMAGLRGGIHTFYVPPGNLRQALLVPGIDIYSPATLAELTAGLQRPEGRSPRYIGGEPLPASVVAPERPWPLSEITGQERAKRALLIAAAGGHNLLLNGPPGTGKSMLAKALPSLLPELSRDEMLEVTHLHSLIRSDYENLITERPFRHPHHSTSYAAMVGGGTRLRPGEVSLSHYGVLFLDEMPEFGRQIIESLRQPLEDRVITVTRARDSAEYPANFILVATANPCPCGYYGTSHGCDCPPHRIMEYRRKLSGPIMDRIDLWVDVDNVAHGELLQANLSEADKPSIKNIVQQARDIQRQRCGQNILNADLDNTHLKQTADMQPASTALLNQAAARLELSARSYMRVIKVARTIADLDSSRPILPAHVSEALQYRSRPAAHLS